MRIQIELEVSPDEFELAKQLIATLKYVGL
jgi:hypothetical protein